VKNKLWIVLAAAAAFWWINRSKVTVATASTAPAAASTTSSTTSSTANTDTTTGAPAITTQALLDRLAKDEALINAAQTSVRNVGAAFDDYTTSHP